MDCDSTGGDSCVRPHSGCSGIGFPAICRILEARMAATGTLDRPAREVRESKPDPGLPSAARMALGLAREAVGTILRVGTGKSATVPADVARDRLAACTEGRGLAAEQILDGHCDRLTPDGRCGSMEGCGCWVESASKRAAKDCPLGRWPKSIEGG